MALRCAAEPMRTWLVLAAFCGLRAGEIARLTTDSLSPGPTGGWVLDVDGKGGQPRTVPVPAVVAELLLPHVRARAGGMVFRNMAGRPVGGRYISGGAARFLHGLGVDKTLHKLRHRYASSMYGLSRDLRLVQELLGHSSPATTTIYVAASAARGQSTADELAATLAPRRARGGAA